MYYQVTYGSTDMVSPVQFVDELSHLGQTQGRPGCRWDWGTGESPSHAAGACDESEAMKAKLEESSAPRHVERYPPPRQSGMPDLS